jgi:hypothetical protein
MTTLIHIVSEQTVAAVYDRRSPVSPSRTAPIECRYRPHLQDRHSIVRLVIAS